MHIGRENKQKQATTKIEEGHQICLLNGNGGWQNSRIQKSFSRKILDIRKYVQIEEAMLYIDGT